MGEGGVAGSKEAINQESALLCEWSPVARVDHLLNSHDLLLHQDLLLLTDQLVPHHQLAGVDGLQGPRVGAAEDDMAATKGDQARVRGGDFEELVWCRGRAVQPAEKLGTDQNYFILYPALRALGLLLADGAPTVGRGKTF